MSNQTRRIVITGIGMVTPLGNDLETTWNALMAGKSGAATIQSFDASGFPTKIAAEVKQFDIHQTIPKAKWLKQSVPFVNFALAAAKMAFDDAGIVSDQAGSERTGCVVGSGMMTTGYEYWQRVNQTFNQSGELDNHAMGTPDGLRFFSPIDFAKAQSNAGLGLLCQQFNIRGYANAVHTACASGGQAIGLALQSMRRDESDVMLVGGYDSMINPFGISAFCLLGALSTYNDTPETASRPFDLTRNGFVLGEGAAFLILEDYERAIARKARIYAEVAGEGNTLSSYRITDSPPDGGGAWQAIDMALRDANLRPEQIDYINAHGTSTKMNDYSETNAIKHVFGERAYQIPVSSTKSQTGHLIAAAGSLEAALTAMMIEKSVVLPTANHHQADPECNLDYVIEGVRQQPIRAALSNSFGFGGSNSCLIIKHPEFV